MYPQLYRQLAEIDQNHWWLRYRRRLAGDLLAGYGGPPAQGAALDLGCGTGGNLDLLASFCRRVTAVDVSELALELARQKYPRYEFRQVDINHLADFFDPGGFDLVSVFNVLYHQWVKSDRSVCEQINQVLRLGGLLLITEPAFNFLDREHDRLAMSSRRYTLPAFKRMLEQSGFEVLAASYFNAIFFLPALALALFGRLNGCKEGADSNHGEVSELKTGSDSLNQMILSVFNLERWAIKTFGRLPFGVSLICLARKM